ncbi:helix-turn-helix domain-containing protein [Kribbella sp. NBC_00709]|uniref:helix-turn-helix domain-containing protein n=1 Tax=Kribbella sp. NBC_00709 TaxID=2975972 RepID=UPI002E2DAD0C|nr:helix-turn-helix domain-containing protein [Kribbella sp. NBC_00709]
MTISESYDAGRLAVLGVSPLDEQLYRLLLKAPGSTLTELTTGTGIGTAQARLSVRRLLRCGLVSRRPGRPPRYVPAPPDVAVGALIAQQHDELQRARLTAESLLADFHRGTRYEHTSQVVELIGGRDAVNQRAVQLMRSAEEEVLILDKPPYVGAQDNPDEMAALARGVRWRAIYSTESLTEPGQLATMTAFREAGEQARLSPMVPTKLAIVDRRLALLPLSIDGPAEGGVLLHPSSMLSLMITFFENMWERSIPFDQHLNGGRPPAKSEQRVLQLLSAGLKDEAIARQLGISLRTTRRWIAHVMADRGVTTRFQLGLVVARELTS